MKNSFGNFNNRKGSTLPMVLMVMLVLIILGITILSLGLSEATFASRQLNRTQAYFSARSGAEVGIEQIETALTSGTYQDTASLFAAVNYPFNGSVNAGEDSHNVSFIGDSIDEDRIKIYSEGTYKNTSDSTAVTIYFTSPNYIDDGWLNPGQIIKAGFWEKTTGPVVVSPTKLLGHAPKKSSNSNTTWRAPSIHFIKDEDNFSLEVTAKKLIIQTNLLSFQGDIYTDSSSDSLKLETFNEQGFLKDDGTVLAYNTSGDLIPEGWGVVAVKSGIVRGNNKNNTTLVFDPGYYAYKPGAEISNDDHTVDPNQIIKITNTATINYIDSVINKETSLGFDPTLMRWSKN